MEFDLRAATIPARPRSNWRSPKAWATAAASSRPAPTPCSRRTRPRSHSRPARPGPGRRRRAATSASAPRGSRCCCAARRATRCSSPRRRSANLDRTGAPYARSSTRRALQRPAGRAHRTLTRDDELGRMGRAIVRAAASLGATISAIARNATAVGNASEELASVSQQMFGNAQEDLEPVHGRLQRRRAGARQRPARGRVGAGSRRQHP